MSKENKQAWEEMLRNRGWSDEEIADFMKPAVEEKLALDETHGGGLLKEVK